MGLGEMAHVYRDRLVTDAEVGGPGAEVRSEEAAAALTAINEAVDAMVRNPNEELLLQALLLRLPAGR